MAATVDTLKIAKRFREARTDDERAEAFAEAFRDVHAAARGDLATKADLAGLELRLEQRLGRLEAGQNLHRWMTGFVLAGVAALLTRALFPA